MFAIPQAIKRRKRLLLTLSGLAAILLAIGGVLYWHSRESLLEFVDRDLRKLNNSQQTGLRKLLAEYLPDAFPGPRTRLNRMLERILPEEFRPTEATSDLYTYETWHVWCLETETNSRFVVFQVRSSRYFVIDNWSSTRSQAAIHFLDANGTHESHSVIFAFWWKSVRDASLLHHELLDAPIIQITADPLIGPGNAERWIYALFENRVALMRIEDLNGNPIADWNDLQMRLTSLMRTPEEWEVLLLSSSRRDILEALTWIGGKHWSGTDENAVFVDDEVVKDGRLAEAVRKRPAIQRRIAELTLSENRWLREAAVFAQQSLPK